MRVRVARISGRIATVECAGRWIELLCPNGHDAIGLCAPTAILLSPVEITRRGDRWQITDAWGFRPALPPEATPQFQALLKGRASDSASTSAALSRAAARTALLQLDDSAYPGALRVVATGATAFDIINHVPLEQYLPGVLARELYRHWHLQTFAAQAIAARSFACHEHDFFGPRRHFDVTNDVASQVYAGEVGHERAHEAVRLTRGVVIGYRGRLVPAYYSSCCGGRAAAASDVMGPNPCNDLPPLRGRSESDVCTGAPLFEWSIERSLTDVITRLRGWGGTQGNEVLAGLDSLLAIEVADVNPHGRPTAFRLRLDAQRSMTLGAEKLRRALDWTGRGIPRPKRPIYASCFRAEIKGSQVRFTGHGYGHGVGMCQYGAEALAQLGEDHESVLRWYYPDVEILRAYGETLINV